MSNENTFSINLYSCSNKNSTSQSIEKFNTCLNGDSYKINDENFLEINSTDLAILLHHFLKDRMAEFDWYRLKRDVEKQLLGVIDCMKLISPLNQIFSYNQMKRNKLP